MSADIEDSGPALAQRVAALEAAVDRLEAAVEPLTRTRRGFLADCRVDVYRAGFSPVTVRITHLPTGLSAEGEWDAAVDELALKLLSRGGISVNDARAARGLPAAPAERSFSAEELSRIAIYGACEIPGCGGALATRLADLGGSDRMMERYCPDCSAVQ